MDLQLGDLHGLDVIEELRRSPHTADVPVVVVTSTTLSDADRERLPLAVPVLSKAHLTRELVQATLDRVAGHAMTPAHVPGEPS